MEAQKSDLEKYFEQNNQRLIHKWNHYFDIYERHFSRFRGKDIVMLEIGVSQGGSLQMWKDYFGPNARIYGVDIDSRCKDMEEENVKIYIGSQSDRSFLQKLRQEIPKFDILLDDGGHTMEQQIVSYEELFDHLKDDGVYLCEDLMTSYWASHGGGYKKKGTFIEYSKNFVDRLNAFHSIEKGFEPDEFTRSVNSLHYYDGVLVIEKRKREKPVDIKTGEASFVQESPHKKKKKGLTILDKIMRRLKV